MPPKTSEPRYDNLPVPRKLKTREKADRLAAVLTGRRGKRVSRPMAIDWAISRALKALERKRGGG